MRPLALLTCVATGATLPEWIDGLVINVPAFSLPPISVPVLGNITLEVTGGQCNKLQAESFSGRAESFNTTNPETQESVIGGLDLAIDLGVGLSCELDTRVDTKVLFVGDVTLDLFLDFEKASQLGLTLRVGSDLDADSPLPASVAVSACDAALAVGSATATASNKLIQGLVNDALKALGSAGLSKMLNGAICGIATDANLTAGITADLVKLDKEIRASGALVPTDPLTPPAPPADALNITTVATSAVGRVAGSLVDELVHLSNVTDLNHEIFNLLNGSGALEKIKKALEGPFEIKALGGTITGEQFGLASAGLSQLKISGKDDLLGGDLGIGATGLTGVASGSILNISSGLIQSTAGPLDLPQAQVSATLGAVQASLSLMAFLNADKLRAYNIDQYQHGSCLCKTLTPSPWNTSNSTNAEGLGALSVLQLVPQLYGVKVELGWGAADPMLKNVSTLLEEAIGALVVMVGPTVDAALRGAVAKGFRDQINAELVASVATCQETSVCPASNATGVVGSDKAASFTATVMGIAAVGAASLLLLAYVFSTVRRRMRMVPRKGAAGQPGQAPGRGRRDGDDDQDDQDYGGPLAFHPRMPRQVSYAAPVLLLVAATAFVIAQTSVFFAAAFNAGDGAPGSQGLDTINLVNLTIFEAIHNLWAAGGGGKLLAVLTFAASILLPYGKLLILGTMWFVPASTWGVHRRDRVLVIMDQIGKVTLADCSLFAVLSIMLQAPWSAEGDPSTRLQLGVSPRAGYIWQVFGTGVSLVVGHAMLAAHRIVERESNKYIVQASVVQSTRTMSMLESQTNLRSSSAGGLLASFADALGGNSEGNLSVAQLAGHAKAGLVTLLLSTTLGLMLGGTFVGCFKVHWTGAVTSIRGLMHDGAYDYWTMWELLVGLTRTGLQATAACIFVEALLIIFCFIVPIAFIAAMLVLWLCPMKPAVQYRMWVVLQVVCAWGAMDIFTGAIFLSGLFSKDIYNFVNYSMEHGNLQPICAGLQGSTGVVCIGAEPGLQMGIALILTAVILWVACAIYVHMVMTRIREGKMLQTM